MSTKSAEGAMPELALACWGLVCVASQLLLLVTGPAAGASHWVLNEERGVIELVPLPPQSIGCAEGGGGLGSCKADGLHGSSFSSYVTQGRQDLPTANAGNQEEPASKLQGGVWQQPVGDINVVKESVASLFEGTLQGKSNAPSKPRLLSPEPALAILFESRYGGVDKALDLLEQSTKSNPMDPVLWSDLGNAYRVKGESEKAVQCFETALRIQPHPDFFLNLGGVHFALGELEEAVQLFTIGLQMNPRHALLQFSMGSIFAVQGKKEEAINSFETTLRIQPDFKPAEQYLLQLRQEMGRKWRTLSRDVWVLLGVFAVTVILVQRAVHRAFMRPDQEQGPSSEASSETRPELTKSRSRRERGYSSGPAVKG